MATSGDQLARGRRMAWADTQMRILTLSNCPLDKAQGSGYVILNYVRALRERGHRVDLLGPVELGLSGRGQRGIRYRQMFGMARQALSRRRGYDVLEFYGGEAWLATILLRGVRNRPLLVAHSNGLEPFSHRLLRQARHQQREAGKWWYRPELSSLYQWAFRAADGLVTVSDFDRNFALRSGYLPEQRVVAIDNPLPESYLALPLSHQRDKKMIFCGSWIERKGVSLLRRDATAFLAARPDWRLVLVGMAETFKVTDHFPAALAGQIEVIGPVERTTELRALYQQCRIAIQTSVYESFGLAVAEAMACGCALVATPVGFAAALKDGEEALLTSAQGLVPPLVRLAEDEDLRRRIAAAGHRRVQALRWGPAADRLESAYQRWLAERAGSIAKRRAPA